MAFPFNFSRLSLTTLFHYKSKVKGEVVRSHTVTNPYHAVSVVPGQRACEAVRSTVTAKYLSSEAPSLPLPACNADKCTCRYQHHTDRRSDEPRRESDVGVVSMNGAWNGRVERRRKGRRITDT